MKQYRIEILGPRQKVALIKCLRTFGNIGLKQAKDLIEEHVSFEEWLDETVTVKMVVTAEQLGNRYAHQVETRYNDDYYIDSVEELKPTLCDINIAML